MNQNRRFREELRDKPFESYNEYMDYIFACVNFRLSDYIEGLMNKYDAGQGNYKNVMYPDIEIAHDLCNDRMMQFMQEDMEPEEEETELPEVEQELNDLLSAFSMDEDELYGDEEEEEEHTLSACKIPIEEMMDFIDARISVTDTEKVKLPFYELCHKLGFGHFSTFALASAILSSTQTSYASVYQIVNENGSLTAPTVESTSGVCISERISRLPEYMAICRSA